MTIISRYFKRCRVNFIMVSYAALAVAALCLPTIEPVKSVGDNIFTLVVNGVEIGKCDTPEEADSIINEARRKVAGDVENMVLIEADNQLIGSEVLVSKVDDHDEMVAKVYEQYSQSVKPTMQKSYTVKIDEYMVNLASLDEALTLLDTSIKKYDTEGKFQVSFTNDATRELPVQIPIINKVETTEIADVNAKAYDVLGTGGLFEAFDNVLASVNPVEETNFDDYDYGIVSLSFPNSVEVIESYLPASQVSKLSDAIDEVTKDKEQKTIYEVVSGDTLSGIATKTGISMDDLIALNENLTNANSVIRVGDELTITVPKPELSVAREELEYYEGTYEAPIEYIYNDSWYTTQAVTRQDPSSGFHKAVRKVTYLNNDIVSQETVMEEVVAEAIPKIVEKGTKIPPTYIKPISGGRITSTFGYRTSTMAGMLSNHRAIDWACPLGTSVAASCGGTVYYAGWMSSYGYVVFINHPDGRQTRYAHLSRILVSAGQSVSQGQKIALSGSTGVSTGPHLHFEMRIGGVAVNPLNYISY